MRTGRSKDGTGRAFVPGRLATVLALVLSATFAAATGAVGGGPASAQEANAGMTDVGSWSSVSCPGAKPTDSPYLGMDGRVRVCLRVSDVPAGTYHVFFQDYLLPGLPTAPTTSGPGLVGAGPAVDLVVTPTSAEPGQTVNFTGTLAKDYAAKQGYLDFCWGGCPNGLQYSGVPVKWQNGRTFSGRLTLPAAPWLERDGQVASPRAGRYELGVQCVVEVRGCAGGPAEGEAAVTLTSAAAYTCSRYAGCTSLEVTPGTGSPGDVVELSGHVPLMDVIGSNEAFGLSLTEARGRAPHGVVIAAPMGPVDIGSATLNVKPAPTFASLGLGNAVSLAQVGNSVISANPAGPGTVAWCGTGYIDIVRPSGTTLKVPIAPALAVLKASSQFQPFMLDQCDAVSLGLSGGAVSPVYAAFAVQPRSDGEPPFAIVGMYTTDGGTSWKLLPVPPGASETTFGGYRYGRDGQVQAFFVPQGARTADPVPVVEQASPSGGFGPAALSCPSAGPCTQLGAYPAPVNCAMGDAAAQPVLGSEDGGKTWRPASATVPGLPTCMPAGLVAFSGRQELMYSSLTMVGAISLVPVLYSSDGGRHWEVVSLPALPPLPADEGAPEPSLLALPTGGFIDLDQGALLLLPAKGSAWCPVAARSSLAKALRTAVPSSFTVVGDRVWWLSSSVSGGAVTATSSGSVPVADLSCR